MPHVNIITETDVSKVKDQMDNKTIVIIDEADEYILDRQETLPEEPRVLCLSATDFGRNDSVERKYADFLGLKVIDSRIPNALESDPAPTQVDDIESYFKLTKDFDAKIVVCHSNDAWKVV